MIHFGVQPLAISIVADGSTSNKITVRKNFVEKDGERFDVRNLPHFCLLYL